MKKEEKEYNQIISLYDNEMSRFWTRFNIFIGFEIAILIGIFSIIRTIFHIVVLTRIILLFVTIISLLFFLIIIRSLCVNLKIVKILINYEEKNIVEYRIFSTYKKEKFPLVINGVLAMIISGMFFAFFLLMFIYFEFSKFCIEF